ncbi:FKBP-type peptidyl-prolyl cis-trans isomerase [Pilimelia columellifera]
MAAKHAAEARRRRNAWIGAAGAAIVVAGVIAGAFWLVGSDEPAKPAAAPSPQAPQEEPPAPTVETPPALKDKPKVTAGTGAVTALKVTPVVQGTGPAVKSGQTITVNYVGVTYKDGKEFDSSWKRGEPASFGIGVGQVIPGWDKGLVGVKVGSRVQLDIPAAMAYGETAVGGRPGGTLRFVVDVLSAED